MSDIEYLLGFAKQCHDAKDAAEILSIVQDIRQLECLYQTGSQSDVERFIQRVVYKHQEEADKHDKGRPPAQDIHQLYRSCRSFLMELGRDKVEKKVRGKITEEALDLLRK